MDAVYYRNWRFKWSQHGRRSFRYSDGLPRLETVLRKPQGRCKQYRIIYIASDDKYIINTIMYCRFYAYMVSLLVQPWIWCVIHLIYLLLIPRRCHNQRYSARGGHMQCQCTYSLRLVHRYGGLMRWPCVLFVSSTSGIICNQSTEQSLMTANQRKT